MTFKQALITSVISLTFLFAGMCRNVQGESYPPTHEGRKLHYELSAYVDKYIEEVGITPTTMQWSTLVLPILELESPAVTYGWALPPPQKGPVKIWIALFTFHQDLMLLLEPNQRRTVAAHEVAHMTGRCMSFQEPDYTGMGELEAALAEFKWMLLVESCADILSAELTNAPDVLSTLKFFRNHMYQGNALLIQRIRVIERLIEREEHDDE